MFKHSWRIMKSKHQCSSSSYIFTMSLSRFFLFVVPPTIISEGPIEHHVISGAPVTLGCDAVGDPPPSVRWRKDSQEINFYDPATRYLLSEKGSLLILEAYVEDSGRFLCVVENPAGVVTREMSLQVLGENLSAM